MLIVPVCAAEFPILFHKPKTSITRPFCPIVMLVQAPNVDCENELCFVISQDVKDVSVQEIP